MEKIITDYWRKPIPTPATAWNGWVRSPRRLPRYCGETKSPSGLISRTQPGQYRPPQPTRRADVAAAHAALKTRMTPLNSVARHQPLGGP